MLDKVFESFTQVNPESNRKHGGTGLGLSIVKNIVTQLNGKISLESKLGKGSVFKVVIPFKMIENSSLNDVPLVNNIDYGLALKGLKILLAEDNTMNQKLVIMMLKKFDLKIDLAETGVEALKALKSNFYDLILMDIQMPDMDGIEATKIIRKDFPNDKKNIPIIALTAHAFQEELDKCIEVGMNAHVIKPIEIQDFLNTIVNCVNVSKRELVMDLSYLKGLSGGDHQMLKDIILTYQAEMPEILMELTKGFEKSDAQHLGRMAHKAKSSFKMLGMESANNALVQIEIKAKNNQLSGVNELIGLVQNQFEMAMKSLSESVLKN
jgi:CheY-like chemotaxis protein